MFEKNVQTFVQNILILFIILRESSKYLIAHPQDLCMDNSGILVHFVVITFISAPKISKLSMIISIKRYKIRYFSINLRVSEQLLINTVTYIKIHKKTKKIVCRNF